jgi:hypothetical protein
MSSSGGCGRWRRLRGWEHPPYCMDATATVADGRRTGAGAAAAAGGAAGRALGRDRGRAGGAAAVWGLDQTRALRSCSCRPACFLWSITNVQGRARMTPPPTARLDAARGGLWRGGVLRRAPPGSVCAGRVRRRGGGGGGAGRGAGLGHASGVGVRHQGPCRPPGAS